MQSLYKNIISFSISNPERFIQLISTFYRFNSKQVQCYKNILDNKLLLSNTFIEWNSEILKQFKSKEDWELLSLNESVFKNVRLIDEFYDLIHWKDPNQGLFFTIANNRGLPWSYELIQKYSDSWDYYQMSYNVDIPWTENLIDEHIDEWDWSAFALNENLPWSVPFIRKYLNRIDVDNFFFKNNQGVTGNFEVVNEYGHLLDWDSICNNTRLPWCEKNLLELWSDKIDWDLVKKKNFFTSKLGCSVKNIDKYLSDESDFESISTNLVLPWSISLIERFIDKWDWKLLSFNKSLPWSIEFIDYFKDYIYWGKVKNEKVVHDEYASLVDYDTFMTWKDYSDLGLESNESVPWSLELITKFERKIDLELLFQNKSVWDKVFKPYIDEKLIDTVFRII